MFKKSIFLLITICLLSAVIWFILRSTKKDNIILFPEYRTENVKIGRKDYLLYIADTEEKRNQGLSKIIDLPKDQGMLFIFEKKDRYSFWMKDMNFSLDFIFLNDNQIVDLKENVLKEAYPEILTPKSEVNAVIELNSSEIILNQVKTGDKIILFK